MRMRGLSSALGLCLIVGGCTSLLGDFEVTPGLDLGPDAASSADGSATDGTTASDGNGGGGDGGDGSALECEAGAKDCVGNRVRHCVNQRWVNQPCGDDRPICIAGDCAIPTSCTNLLGLCPGPNNCCSAPIAQGTTFNRFNRPAFPATVSDVKLARFEVTVARFRAFIAAGRGITPAAPAAGSGAHPKIPNSGWQVGFNGSLQPTTAALESAVTACGGFSNATYQPAGVIASNNKPMNCVTFVEAFAFCIWDGGRLPTVAELELATRGGMQQRAFPWGPEAIDATRAFVCPNAAGSPCLMPSPSMLDVGSRPMGIGRWGHLDLFGSMREYTLDIYTPMPPTCDDCAQLNTGAATTHGAVGGSWSDTVDAWMSIYNVAPTTSTNPRTPAGGFRCAYDL